MNKLDSARISDIEARVESGLRQHATSRQSKTRAVRLADQIVAGSDAAESVGLLDVGRVETVGESFSQVDHDSLRRLRKITEVVEDDLRVDVGHSKLARAAGTGANLVSVGAFVLAGHTLLISAATLDRAYEKAGTVRKVDNKLFFDFYASICVFIAEGFLMTTPLNYKFAWKGTRYLNNRYLYRFREYSSALYRLLLSEIHYAIRGIIPAALRDTDAFVTYLSSMTVQTIEMLRQVSDKGIGDLRQQVQEIVTEFRRFVEQQYEVVTPDVDIETLALEIYQRLSDGVDLPTIPTDWDLSTS